MKILHTVGHLFLSLVLLSAEIEARGESRFKGADGSRKKPTPPQRSSNQRRSPMTGSKIVRPKTKPTQKPAQRPQTRPSTKPATKPIQRPELQKPDTHPSKIPDRNPIKKPTSKIPDRGDGAPNRRPVIKQPGKTKPATLPGMVTYPKHPSNKKPGDTIKFDRDKINISRDRNNLHIDQINIGRRNVGLNRPNTLPARKPDWNPNKWGGNKGVWGNRISVGNDINIKIDRHFQNNQNFSYRPDYWGSRPWWGAGAYHDWHHGHWNYGWNSHYYHHHWWYNDDDFASGFMWGIAVWSLGNMIYDMGYQSYHNPYPAPPVQNTYITYTEPVSVAAASHPPGDEGEVALAEEKSDTALTRSMDAFKSGDYSAASKAIDEALAYTPSDVTLHEFRALVFFALGKYADATGILNPVLASGPGWSWDTMIGFYPTESEYDTQLRKLEAYAKNSPDRADAHFLLGYHYMVCGHMEEAYQEFEITTKLQPADSIALQLRDLTKNSLPDAGEPESGMITESQPSPIPSEKLVGTWVSDRGPDGKIFFTLQESGDYLWKYTSPSGDNELSGTYGLDDKGLLILTADDSQMVSAVTLNDDNHFHFNLIGAPDGDPGLEFTKS
ncbi:tetratricopeptide repeat protein [Luteolibacter pohnpeiensis]|uniref:Tetratricopeptide repeat protein n=1 Tax=Luteolibacter pohnpeiensis TaxID=454153 RepID=A0A934S1Z4_9BACT|nr:tetratricopeptide repeat protein [Luteolibacter pohnpeiensis]MBK1880916.1 tetratricopeptide repeat protein [Luteolibacter pohnpeiensis]